MTGAERRRLHDAERGTPWRRWGPYLADRQWGTVREAYGGDAWTSFTHDQARYRAYRWGEDGIAGISDDAQRLCLAVTLWNGVDPILKERLFGLGNGEGNHGEDVKESYFHLDATPTASYLRMLYRYPQREFPYQDLISTNRERGRDEPEYELADTGVFADDRYFDVVVEYAKAGPDDILMRITAHNRGDEDRTLHVLPTLWFRHTWSWAGGADRPHLRATAPGTVVAHDPELGRRSLVVDRAVPVLVTGNETDNERVFGSPNESPYVKDGIERVVVHGEPGAVSPDDEGTKASAHCALDIPAGHSATVRVRLTDGPPDHEAAFSGFDTIVATRRAEADEFHVEVAGADLADDERTVVRRAFAGLLWSKQFYALDVERWLTERGVDPLADTSLPNHQWRHLVAEDVVAMPDKWEYPWFAAWDSAFHAAALAAVDPAFAKHQLELLLDRRYLHPNGQLPAYEWNFGDVNPPVHAWAVWFVYELEGRKDKEFLARTFPRLLRYFDWWLNRKDADGRNVFQGGFLGLDNIGVFDRNAALPTGGRIDQADGTAWMALFCQNLICVALELGEVEQAQSLLENLAWISAAAQHEGVGFWDEEDGFFYDVLRTPDGGRVPLRVRSVVGLLPLAAATVVDGEVRTRFPQVVDDAAAFLERHPAVANSLWGRGSQANGSGTVLFSLFDETRLRRLLARMLDEDEFLSPHGIRSLSRWHLEHPYVFTVDGQEHRVGYLPAESDSSMFGGNSNWRGPVWFPINVMLIRALLHLHVHYGDKFTVECPTGSGRHLTLRQVAGEIGDRLFSTFLPDDSGVRPSDGGGPEDPALFHEYFHGDDGTGLGAAHQTGWTATVALLPALLRGTGTSR
ncbi:glucosidase [Saccharothrix violaceirubra]|uniref:Mannosylglycerate hydrolase MGH1-like glycoside hydrolase domain-containing protein n=1 Tax=Saccharothrix violaceirubra TaxID=413306 RepID=A0A7W7WWZ2_9PSEU|nr:glucosidase [Saccharothrix violaceirubra]MBB4966512.1 hypothetical protein [Saccharothrix violaceirubra]